MTKIQMQQPVLGANNQQADKNREAFNQNRVLVVNLMSSPGAGKTTILERTIRELGSCNLKVGVIEGDLATSVDAERIRAAGAQAVQINTGGGCHLDARMIAGVLSQFDLAELDILFIENVGNLVCPASFDLGESLRVTVLSVTEGNDKIIKYPIMFRKTQVVLLNKIDLLPYVQFNLDQAARDLATINPANRLVPLSATTGEGFTVWIDWLKANRQQW